MRKLAALLLCFGLTQPGLSRPQLSDIRTYIKHSWTFLLRTHGQLLEAAMDPKLGQLERWPVYVSQRENLQAVRAKLQGEMPADKFAKLEIRQLGAGEIREHGLLYLPKPYVVPGGRFNEMYGWDSYFILLGLLKDGETQKARDMVENFLYEVENYGAVLNANRSYYLTRSQPPFLSRMVLALGDDPALLRRAWPDLVKTYDLWTTPPHQPDPQGLSVYFDTGNGPAPEVLVGERDAQGRSHYERIADFFATADPKVYDITPFYQNGKLTAEFYKGDRSMRESGFDPSNRFGPFNVDVVHYYPVELNTLLWVFENDMAEIASKLGKSPEVWKERARLRREKIQNLLWDDEKGLFLDYRYPLSAAAQLPIWHGFFPLWAGLATPEQARRLVENLPLLEREGGLLTSPFESGNQWDAPFGWAPLQLVAVEGLRNYGYQAQADRLSVKWLSLVWQEFVRTGIIVEKYDVVSRSSQVSASIKFGYSSNEIGFGWTNGAFLVMLDALRPAARQQLLESAK